MEIDELAERIAQLENDKAQGAAMAAQQAFIGQHGSKFSNDESIGSAILGELSKRGVGAADVGADAVVQEILDAIRTEAMSLLDKIKNVEEAVAAATGEAPAGDMPPEGMLPPEAAMPPEGMLPPEAAMPPEAVLPPEGAMPPMPEEMGAPPAMSSTPEEEPAPMPPAAVVSDKRMKLVQAKKPGWRPSAHIVSAARGGR